MQKSFRKILVVLLLFSILTLFSNVIVANSSSQYKVKQGDSLYKIGKMFNVTVESIKSINSLKGDEILIGQVLGIPKNYTIKKGDTLYKIANNFGITLNQLRRANNIWGSIIMPGQVILIPTTETATQSSLNYNYSVNINNNDLNTLARLVHSEAEGESYTGKVAVAAVVLNRVRSSIFPNSIRSVVYQVDHGYYQFSPVLDGRINLTPNNEAYRAARDAINGWDPTNGALYFFNPRKTSNQWLRRKPVSTVIDNHVFTY